MIIRDLSNVDFKILIDCFNKSFDQYFVKMPTDPQFWKTRWTASKVDYSLSFGMFDQGELVGFIIHAVDERSGQLVAYNAGTGVVPSYRGRRIVKSLYEHAVPILLGKNINRFILEVVKDNIKAIKSYESTGFKIIKSYKTYHGELDLLNDDSYVLKEVKNFNFDLLPNQQQYSWDFHKSTITRKKYRYFKVMYKNHWESFFILDINNGYVAQFDLLVDVDDKSGWNRLFNAIYQKIVLVKLNNVDERASDKIMFIESLNLENIVDQYEMELIIPTTSK